MTLPIRGLLPGSPSNLKGIFMSYGFVYLLLNRCMPGLIKIGFTERSPSQRAYELSNGTGVPEAFILLAYFELPDARDYEQSLHDVWSECRVNHSREFFELSVPSLVELIESGIEMAASSFISKEAMQEHVECCKRIGMPFDYKAHTHA